MKIDEAAVLAARHVGRSIDSLTENLRREGWVRKVRHTMASETRFQTTYQANVGIVAVEMHGPRLIVWSEMTEKGAVTNVFAEVRDGRS